MDRDFDISAREMMIRLFMAVVTGGVGYMLWLVAFLLLPANPMLRTGLWVLAPVVTGLGYGLGARLGERATDTERSSWLSLLLWPVLACGIGALITYQFGSMLVVFGVMVAGALAALVRELTRPAPRP